MPNLITNPENLIHFPTPEEAENFVAGIPHFKNLDYFIGGSKAGFYIVVLAESTTHTAIQMSNNNAPDCYVATIAIMPKRRTAPSAHFWAMRIVRNRVPMTFIVIGDTKEEALDNFYKYAKEQCVGEEPSTVRKINQAEAMRRINEGAIKWFTFSDINGPSEVAQVQTQVQGEQLAPGCYTAKVGDVESMEIDGRQVVRVNIEGAVPVEFAGKLVGEE